MRIVGSTGLAVAILIAAISISPPPVYVATEGNPSAWARLQARAQTQGSVRVILKLNTSFAVEGRMNSRAASAQRAEIANSQGALLQRGSWRDASSTYRFQTIPYLAVEVDAVSLAQLRTFPEVADIQEDEQLQPLLRESAVLTGASAVRAEGFSGSGWTVAILDDGVDRSHPFLAGRVVSEACFSTNGPSSNSLCPGGASSSTAAGSASYCPYSSCGHGTHVAGIAAGRSASFSGIAPDANIVAIQVFSAVPGGLAAFTSDVIRGLERVYTVAAPYRIAAVNLSLGFGGFTSACDSSVFKPIIDNLRSIGVATVAASGNDGYGNAVAQPACVSTAVSVGSTDDGSEGSSADSVSWFSNSASILKLLAPGRWIYSSIPGGTYANRQGTSMAAPHVTGAWAVLKQAAPTASVDTILAALTNTGRPVFNPLNGLTRPRIEVDLALAPLGRCRYSMSKTAVNVPAAGGTESVLVGTFPRNCSWTASTSDSWLTITSGGGAQTGNAVVWFSVAPNTSSQSRSGTLNIAGRLLTIHQAGTPCTFTFSPPADFDPSGGPGTAPITPSPSDCSWSATSSESWISLGVRNGMGPGAVTFDVAPNDTPDLRTGTIAVGLHAATLTQHGESGEGGCSFNIDPTAVSVDANGGDRNVTVAPSAQACTWSVRSNWPWITLSSPNANVGSGALRLSVAPNQGPAARAGAVLVGGMVLPVTQAGRGARRWDVDGDAVTDLTVWRPVSGMWFILKSQDQSTRTIEWGSSRLNDVPVPGDYDGDSRGDPAVWRPASGTWFILTSSSEYTSSWTLNWGSGTVGDVPVPGDYDGDGKTDIAVWRPASGRWFILKSSASYATTQALTIAWGAGAAGDVVVPADYDGDGLTDIAVWRPSSGIWYVKTSTSNFSSHLSTTWGTALVGDRPVVGDYDGDGKADRAVWRAPTGTWFILRSSGSPLSIAWGSGALADVPVVGDYDGDGRADITVWRPGTGRWHILRSTAGYGYAGAQSVAWGSGAVNDVPIPNR